MLSVFTSRKVYSSQIKAVNLQTISELQKLSPIWREWDKKHAERHVWLPIPDPPKPGTPKPRPMPMMVHSTAIILANLSRGMATCHISRCELEKGTTWAPLKSLTARNRPGIYRTQVRENRRTPSAADKDSKWLSSASGVVLHIDFQPTVYTSLHVNFWSH